MGLLQDQVVSHLSVSPSHLSLLDLSHVPLALAILLTSAALYRLYFHPLSHVPGPWFACVSHIFLYAICYFGIEGRVLLRYHKKYGTPVLRIAPDGVSISDGEALHKVYIAGGGLPKDARYSNFRIEGHDTIFSAVDQEYRDRRAKAVLPLFAPSRIQNAYEKDGVMAPLVRKFVSRLKEEKGKPNARVDILDLSSRLSIDILTAYLFHRTYGGLGEPVQNELTGNNAPSKNLKYVNKLSATPFVLAIVAFSRFSLLPNWLFTVIFSSLVGRILSNEEVNASVHTVSHFLDGLFETSTASYSNRDNDTYQSRLEQAGVTRSETLVQCKGIVFAGADSTAVMLATILFHLVQQPSVRERLRDEIAAAGTGADPQGLSYLRAVVREGLRLGMANPARLTRIVPDGVGAGLTVSGYTLPPGTKVGAAAYVFHHNPEVYPEPFEFRPERWLPGKNETPAAAQARRVRDRDAFAFGLGGRACLGRNLANHQLHVVVKDVVESGALEGARTCKDKIEIIEWFNAEIKGHELDIAW
ncbi:Pisatin demethylase [Cytospora mali]|uniref:Pisatin demethylase n=1 Tax=Cytospora mali TaxID=578113 RepID=A0A194UMT8_CYTMA|nr:Pisatin demethylase [Valsa mali var. pyri (nom. inval.)]